MLMMVVLFVRTMISSTGTVSTIVIAMWSKDASDVT
jgi:hypothetical protein